MPLSRREWIKYSALASGVAAAQSALPAWMPRLAFAQPYNNPAGDVLVVIFLRGGADALNLIAPHGDPSYYSLRPRLAVPRPGQPGGMLELDDFFGLNPAMAELWPIFLIGHLKAVHATGLSIGTRSHFRAMSMMEIGEAESAEAATTGWLARYLNQSSGNSPLRGIGWGTSLPASLFGAPGVNVLQSIMENHYAGPGSVFHDVLQNLASLYDMPGTDAMLQQRTLDTRDAIDLIQRIGYRDYVPQNGAIYPTEDPFALALRQTAATIRADVGLEVACIDLGGWDTHARQSNSFHRSVTQLSKGLAAFYQDMEPAMGRITVVVMSEFGRRVAENASLGTDHGHGGAMLVMSGNLAPGAVYSRWPGLAPEQLDDGDLAVTTDYRDVLSEIMTQRVRSSVNIFAGHTPSSLGLFA